MSKKARGLTAVTSEMRWAELAMMALAF